MKIKLSEGKMASKADIEALQKHIGEPLVFDFLKFVAGNDGAKPEENIFEIGKMNDAGVDRFIPVHKIPGEMSDLDLPAKSYPVAEASCGNYVFINQAEGGAVFFWDHEEPRSGIVRLADNFRSFLDILEPDDEVVELKSGQVKSVWMDPEFRKEMLRQGLLRED